MGYGYEKACKISTIIWVCVREFKSCSYQVYKFVRIFAKMSLMDMNQINASSANMSRNIKLFIIIFAAIVFVFGIVTLAFRFFNPGAELIPGQKTTLEYWGLFESEQVMMPLIKQYEAENPDVKINYVEKSFTNLEEYKQTLLARAKSGTSPDIYRMHATWSPKFSNYLAPAGGVLSAQSFTDKFYDPARGACVNEVQEVKCIPLMHDGLVLAYNVDMFRDSGVSPNIQSWEDLRLAAKRLSRYEDETERVLLRAGVGLGSIDNVDNFSDILMIMFYQSGINRFEEFASEKAQSAFRFYASFVKDDYIWDHAFPNSINAFASERSAMVFVKTSQMLDILEINPTINMAVLPVPQLPKLGGGTTSDYLASIWVETVSSNSSSNKKVEAWKFLEWLSRPEQQIARFNESSLYKKFGEAYSHKQLRNNLINAPLLGPVVKVAPVSRISIFADGIGNDQYVNLLKETAEKMTTLGGGQEDLILEEFIEDYKKLLQE